jgi:predicted ester cyclase
VGIPPTGKHITVTGIAITRFANGKTVEEWANADWLGLLQQIGALPATG